MELIVVEEDKAQINEGFKKTEVGVIPVDWNVVTIGQYAKKVGSGKTPTGGETVYQKEGRPFLRSQNVGWGVLKLDDLAYISDEIHLTFLGSEIQLDDVLLNITGASIGRSAIATPEIVTGNVNQHVCIIRTAQTEIQPQYLNYILLSAIGQQQIDSYQAGGNREGLNFSQIKSIKLPIPPTLAEQKAIAKALSDVDAVISNLDKLITKKKAIKQGAMQQLLKSPKQGGKRLFGFEGEWEEKEFKEVTNLITCGIAATPDYVSSNVGVPFLSSTNVKNGKVVWNNYKHISQDLHEGLYKNNPPLKGDILYSRVGTIGEAAVIEVDFEFSIYVSLTLIKPKKQLHNYFLMHLLNSTEYKNRANNEVFLGGGVGNLNVDVVRRYPIHFPPTIEEQIAIATILSDMDTEVQNLEKKKAKYQRIKQGMMQELLTGKTRLV